MTLAAENHWIALGEVVPFVLARCAASALITARCESPIEVAFGASLLFLFPEVQFLEPNATRDLDRPCLIPQLWWKQYRIDFALCAAGKKDPAVFIECDGREFHSTSEQISRDRAKDAAAQTAGIHMMRFSGSEIHKHHDTCAQLAMAALARAE